MISDQLGSLLHSRASQGEVLSSVETEQLETWYAEKDAQEAQLLKMPTANVDCVALQAQIDASLEKISTVSQGIRQVTSENAILRQEIFELQQSLVLPESA
jgi:peptidoglycan hydrolase CwlO-like protein